MLLVICMFSLEKCLFGAQLKILKEFAAAAAAKSLQSCPTLCDPMDCSLPGSSVHGFSRQWYWSGSPFPSPADLPNPGIEPGSSAL